MFELQHSEITTNAHDQPLEHIRTIHQPEKSKRSIVPRLPRRVQQWQDGKLITTYRDAVQASNAVGCDSSSIQKAATGAIKKCKGYSWQYAD